MGLALDLEDYHPSVLLHCKIISEMTYNVSSGMLNPIWCEDYYVYIIILTPNFAATGRTVAET